MDKALDKQHFKDELIISSIALAIPAMLFLFCMLWADSALPGQRDASATQMAEASTTSGTRASEVARIAHMLGIRVRPATNHDISHYSLRTHSGAVITWVNPSGPLGRTGMEVNDIILEVNGRPVKDAQDILHILSSHVIRGGLIVRALDHRTGRSGYVQLPLP